MMIDACRSCGSQKLHVVLDLGLHPVSNALLKSGEDPRVQKRHPLVVALCRDCALLQVTETVSASELYCCDFPYFSSTSSTLLAHARAHATNIMRTRSLGKDSLVIEIASNDGYLLRNFVEWGIPALGIDPAAAPAAAAIRGGVPTINDFFNLSLADQLARQGKTADVMIANNVVAHVDGINDFIAAFKRALKKDGIAFFEFAYGVDMIANLEFDTIYHEHLFYHTLTAIRPLFERHGLYVNDVERLPIHGGSLRLHVEHQRRESSRLHLLLEKERSLGVDKLTFYSAFAAEVERHAMALRAFLRELKSADKRVACYGAAAKGATMLNYLDMGDNFFEFVADANPFKQGKMMPGQNLPIVAPDTLSKMQPDYVLVLVWNIANEIVRSQWGYCAEGGRFIVPLPALKIVSADDFAAIDTAAARGLPGLAAGTALRSEIR
jgi:SAM-dependent methyltransferase